MSVRIFHPSTAPFVQQAARALHEAGQLDRFITSIRHDPHKTGQRALAAIARPFGLDLNRELARRAVTEIPPESVESRPWGEWLRLAVGRLDRDGRATDWVWERAETGFDRSVARSLPHSLTGVYGFEHSSLATLRRARSLGIKTVYDVPAPESRFARQLLDREMANFPELVTPWHHWTARREARRVARRQAEFQTADLVIAASTFTRDSFRGTGLDLAKVRVIPYGAPPIAPREAALRGNQGPGRLRLLWAGTFGIRKGAHYLLEAWRKHHLGRHAQLRVWGSVMLPERVIHPIPDGIEFGGSLPRAELMNEFDQADALLFPTLCDGYGMVITEAWSRGVPVITTRAAGAAERLRPEENGLLIEPAQADAIAQAVEWCQQNRNRLQLMREAAFATANDWQWPDYRRLLAQTLDDAGFFHRAD